MTATKPALAPTVIAIDGPAASGKGTLARRLAAELDFAYLDTGKIYRALGYSLLQQGTPPFTAEAACALIPDLDFDLLTHPGLLTEEVAEITSQIAAIPEVRTALLDAQRHYALNPPHGKKGAVLDGRDIGSVVCPDAQVKLYVDASLDVRATRRFQELSPKNPELSYEDVLADLTKRDHRDRTRAVAPLKPCADATELDTSHLSADAAFQQSMVLIQQKIIL